MESLAKIAIDNAIGRKILRDDKKRGITNPRQEALEMFLKKLNPERLKNGYPELTPGRLGMLVSHIKNPKDPQDVSKLHDFYNQCLNYENDGKRLNIKGRSFGKCFHGALKIK